MIPFDGERFEWDVRFKKVFRNEGSKFWLARRREREREAAMVVHDSVTNEVSSDGGNASSRGREQVW